MQSEPTTEAQSTHFLQNDQFIQSLSLGDIALERLQAAYDSISLGRESIDYNFQLESLWSTLPEQDRVDILDAVTRLREHINSASEITKWSDEVKTLLDKIGKILAHSFDFTEDGGELAKGTVYDNLIGFWAVRRDPKQRKDVKLDCKLGTIMLWYILNKEGIQPIPMVRYIQSDRLSIPNGSAHPMLWIPTANFQNPAPDFVGMFDEVAGVNTDFIAKGDGFRCTKIFHTKDIDKFLLGDFDDLDEFIEVLDLFYFAARLVQQATRGWTRPASTTSEAVVNYLKDLFPKGLVKGVVELRFRNYIEHLTNLKL